MDIKSFSKEWQRKILADQPKLYAFFWGMPFYRKIRYVFTHSVTKYSTNLVWGVRYGRCIDMLFSLFRYGISYSEYVLFHFDQLNGKGRRVFIGDCCRKKYYMRLNNIEDVSIFKNKYSCYERFSEFYHRKAILFDAKCGKHNFLDLLQKEFPRGAFIKPLTASGGFGIERVSPQTVLEAVDDLYEIMKRQLSGKFIIEEIVEADSRIAMLNPSSLNTVRVITILDKNNDPHIIGFFLRAGKKGSIVDNAASGGIICQLSDEGIIKRCVDKSGQEYIRHPDSGIMLLGYQVPRWAEAIALAKTLATKVPSVRFCGWDLALTPNGWVMIEGNEGSEFIGIQIFGVGCKQIVRKYM